MIKSLKLAPLTILLIAAVFSVSSCISPKKTIYLQNQSKYTSGDHGFENDLSVYKVKPGDFLYIDVNNLDPKSLSLFEGGSRSDYQLQSDMGVYLKSYQVNDSGFINFPVIGKVMVGGLSINQIKDKMQDIMNEFYQLTTITVKLVNFKVSILGEVVRPGTYSVYQDKLNIFQALSMGGDITPYGNRQNVTIVRKTKTGATEIIKVNLLSNSLLELPGFYLEPEDIIYVEPMRGKNFAFTSFPYSIVLTTLTSAITTTLLILNYYK
ncbi:MAG: polysaccharide biosynthesis/export family protein [Chloroflexota bacterium]|nr:polysaccharide biosynthesis/export family protein [Lentimicrobium sp.]